VFFLISTTTFYCQDNIARLITIIGSQVTFNFNSISKHSTGITKPNRTRFGVRFSDLTGGASGVTQWKVTAEPASATINGDGGSNTLNINVLELQATDANGGLVGSTFSGWQILGNGNPLVTSSTIPASATTHQIDISYRCGVTNSVFDSTSDYYEIEIDFVLSPVP
tara:strand:+ start:1167 stop:1667 length:501 start_codon:yes stop_codon:yes gene_type:complete